MGHADSGSAQWGRYQASASVLMALLKMPAAWFQLSMLFLAPAINYRCAQPYSKNISTANVSEESSVELWDDSCSYFDEGGTQQTCNHWEYKSEEFTYSVNMMWNLVCDQEMVVTWAQVSFMCGVLSGNIVGGFLADRVGRKTVLAVAVLVQPLFSAIVAVVPWFSVFLVFRFLLGLSLGGNMVISFVLGGELGIGPWRPVITILHQVPFGMGQTIFAITAYFLRDWREIQMALSVYCLIFLPYCWLVEESSKWLTEKGKLKEAERVVLAIRKRNGLPHAAHTEMHPMTEKHNVEIVKDCNKMNNNRAEKSEGFCDLFRTPRMRQYTLSIWLMWYCAGLSFFAMNAYQIQLGGSTIVNVGVGGLIGGIPGNILTVFLVRRFSKKKVIIITNLLAGIFAILISLYDVGEEPEDWQRRLLGLFTLVAMSVAFPAMSLLSGELIPTAVRSSVMFVANLMGRLGNTTAPLVGPTAIFYKWMPLALIGAAPLMIVVIMLTLPDTREGPLPETIEDIETKRNKWPETIVIAEEEVSKIYKPTIVQDS